MARFTLENPLLNHVQRHARMPVVFRATPEERRSEPAVEVPAADLASREPADIPAALARRAASPPAAATMDQPVNTRNAPPDRGITPGATTSASDPNWQRLERIMRRHEQAEPQPQADKADPQPSRRAAHVLRRSPAGPQETVTPPERRQANVTYMQAEATANPTRLQPEPADDPAQAAPSAGAAPVQRKTPLQEPATASPKQPKADNAQQSGQRGRPETASGENRSPTAAERGSGNRGTGAVGELPDSTPDHPMLHQSEATDAVPASEEAATPLETAWPVQRKGEKVAEMTADRAPPPSLSNADVAGVERARRALEQVPAQPSASSVELVLPRRPRPSGKPAPGASRKAAPPAPEPARVETEIGPLPADLWTLLDESPAASDNAYEVSDEQPPAPFMVQRKRDPQTAPEMAGGLDGAASTQLPPVESPPVGATETALVRKADGADASPVVTGGGRESPWTPSPEETTPAQGTEPATTGMSEPGVTPAPIQRSPQAETSVAERTVASHRRGSGPEGEQWSPPQAVQRAPLAETDVTGASPTAEVTADEEADPDVEELARRVFATLKHRLAVEWERGRGRF